ncbi:MAG: YceI family protein [Pseudomonadota bacterium]
MRTILAAAAVAFTAGPAFAASLDVPSGTYNVDPSHASVVWKISHLGFSNYTALFDREGISATVELDAENVANSTLSVTLNGLSIETLDPGEKDFNAEIESARILNAAEFPEIVFTSTGIEITSDTTAVINGELTLNGQTHPFSLDTQLNGAGNHPMSGQPIIGVSAEGVLDRTVWGVDFLAGPIGTEVAVEIEAEFLLAE